AGNTLIVIEHNLEMIKCADWIIDLGPEGGERGGEVVGTGPPEEIVDLAKSYTGKYLRPLLEKGMRSVRYISLALLMALAPFARGQFSAQLAEASKPLTEGVPEVAVVRLQALLKQNLTEPDLRAAAEKLLEALVSANQTADAFNLLADPRLRQSPSANFWRAQLLAKTHRESEALALYRQIATDTNSTFRLDARMGAAEMLRALGRKDEALQSFSELFRDPKWNIRAQLRAIELYLDKPDPVSARRLLEKVQPTTTAEKKERHFLRGR